MAKRYNTMEEFFLDEVVHESNVRAMTDDFRVIDNVTKEETDFSVDKEYNELCDKENCNCDDDENEED